jgi:N-acetylated-alpha-linked acidic dipeptidase
LQHLINDVTLDIQDPEKHISVQQRARLQRIARAPNAEERAEIRKSNDVRINALGDGSDYTAFMDYAGISALNLGYGGENDADAYHFHL